MRVPQSGLYPLGKQPSTMFPQENYLSERHVSYKSVPFYMTNEGCGVFVDHATPVVHGME